MAGPATRSLPGTDPARGPRGGAPRAPGGGAPPPAPPDRSYLVMPYEGRLTGVTLRVPQGPR
ncbi:hypothetical protein AAHZ94_30855, partial [Streptomyces sp. HSW2009]